MLKENRISDNARRVLLLMVLSGVVINGACQSPQTAASSDSPVIANPDAKRHLGSFKSIYGTSYLMAPIESETRSEYSSKGGSGNVHNYVFFNTADESVKTLMPTNDYWITQTISFPQKSEGGQEIEPVKWLLYFLVKEDTDGDKKLTYKDNRTLAVSDVSGAQYTELVSDVEEVYGQSIRDSNILFLIYTSKAKKYVAKVDLFNRKVISTSELTLEFKDLK